MLAADEIDDPDSSRFGLSSMGIVTSTIIAVMAGTR